MLLQCPCGIRHGAMDILAQPARETSLWFLNGAGTTLGPSGTGTGTEEEEEQEWHWGPEAPDTNL